MKKLWACLAARFQTSSLQFSLTASFTCVTAIALLVFGLSYHIRSTDLLRRRVGEDNLRIVEQVGTALDSHLRTMMRVSDTIYYTVIKNSDLDHDNLSESMYLLYEANGDKLFSIAVFDYAGTLLASVPHTTIKPGVTPQTQNWFLSAVQRIENFHVSRPHIQNLFYDLEQTHNWVISLSRAVELTRAGAITQGVLLLDLSVPELVRLCLSSGLGEDGYLYLLDEEGRVLYHPDLPLLEAGLLNENHQTAAYYEDGNHLEHFDGQTRMVTVKTVAYTGWKLVGVLPLRATDLSPFPNSLFLVLLVALITVLIGAANTFLSARIAVPIKRLEQAVDELEAGNLDAYIPIGGSEEAQRLGKAIRAMVVRMRALMDDIVREQEAKRKNELEVLQSQINPHFLYNTLDSIVWMVENEKYPDAICMVTSLARLFRISLSKGRSIIPLRAELDHARSYLTIQQMRYKDKFRFVDHTDPALGDLACLKLVVQPLLENAIYHGMEYMVDGEGVLELRTEQCDDGLYLSVIDNGPGIPPDLRAQLLNNQLNRTARRGYGLYNVHERIRLTYGAPYGLSISDAPDGGACVSIHLPAQPFCPAEEERV